MSLGHTNQHDVATQRVTLPRTTGPSQPRYTYDATGKDCVVAVTADASHKEKYVYDASVLPTTPFSRKTADFRCPPSATAMNQESGLYYYGFRFLTTSQGRWISRDSIMDEDYRNECQGSRLGVRDLSLEGGCADG